MKFVFIALALATSAFAQDQQNLEAAKARTAQHLEARISNLQSAKSCVSSASSREALKGCQEKLKSDMQSLREKYKAERAANKQSKQSERAAKKAKGGN